ncbi:MAG: hypothetical protein K9G46_00210 [Flavobacteriales bacterium]|nr:hypothetical protein [Flavobacteriales bacterium]
MRTVTILLLQLLFFGKVVLATPVAEPDSAKYFSGYIIALAWPKAWAKEAGDGYDRLMRGLGFNDGGFYRVGHAALVLVNGADSSCHYFDFGRYHSPFGTGRVRDAKSDHELVIGTKSIPNGKRISNLNEILCEVQSNSSTHASGPLYASYVRIDFAKAYEVAKQLQHQGVIPYGPFEKPGLNCSRFVREVILAGDPNWAHVLRLEVVPMVTPSVLYPVSALYHWTKVPGCLDEAAELLKEQLSALPDSLFRSVLPAPDCPLHVPTEAQWLAGEGAGSWYNLIQQGEDFLLTRYTRTGEQQCAVVMQQTAGEDWDSSQPFTITYPSHCAEVNLLVDNKKVTLRPVDW